MNSEYFIYAPKYGVIIQNDSGVFKSAILLADSGMSTTLHEKSVLIDNENLVIVIGDEIFSLSLPELKLNWNTKCGDCVTCFGLYKLNDFYIVHGECSILRISKTGNIDWEFFGRDIFTTIEGIDVFCVTDEMIIVKNWENNVYKLGLDGKLM